MTASVSSAPKGSLAAVLVDMMDMCPTLFSGGLGDGSGTCRGSSSLLSNGPPTDKKAGKQGITARSLAGKSVFSLVALVLVRQMMDHEFATFLTISAVAQSVAFFLLVSKVQQQQSVAGLSSKMLGMYAISLILRLGCTTLKGGYLPADRRGVFINQVADAGALLSVLALLYAVKQTHAATYDAALDTLPVVNFVAPCVLLATFAHGEQNHSFFFDSLWYLSLYVDTFAMLPQIFMMTKKGGRVEAGASHFVACLFISRVCSFAFWCRGYTALVLEGESNVGGFMILLAHTCQLLSQLDFMYYYAKSFVAQRGRMTWVELPAPSE